MARMTKEAEVLKIMPWERAALQLMADGRPNSEIAGRLRLPEDLIDERLNTLFARMGAGNRTEAIHIASQRELVVMPTR